MVDHIIYQFSTVAPCSFWPWSEGWKNRWSPLVRKMSHSPFSHVDLMLPDGNLLGASDSPDAPIIRGNPRGVAVRPPDYQHFGYRRRMILRTNRADAVTAAVMSQLGKPFDNSGIRNFLSDKFPGVRDWTDTGQWWCSELMGWGEEAGEYWGSNAAGMWPKGRLSPTDHLLIHCRDPQFINADTFWQPIDGLKLGRYEKP